MGLRSRRLIILRQVVVVIRYSQCRSGARPSNPLSPRQARSMASWTASSASV